MGGAALHIDDRVEWDMLLEKTQVVVADCEAHFTPMTERGHGSQASSDVLTTHMYSLCRLVRSLQDDWSSF